MAGKKAETGTHRILFVCHGNICRSPMAEFVMRDICMRAGTSNAWRVASAATTSEELGNPVHPGTRRMLAAHGLGCAGKTARRVERGEYRSWDLFVVMDDENVADLKRLFKGDPDGKVVKLMDFVEGQRGRDVADPWYTGDFSTTWDDITKGCQALYEHLASS